jgi:hypothetical protein
MADSADRLEQALRAKLGAEYDDFTQEDLKLLVRARYSDRNLSKASREGLVAAGLPLALVDVILKAYQGVWNETVGWTHGVLLQLFFWEHVWFFAPAGLLFLLWFHRLLASCFRGPLLCCS